MARPWAEVVDELTAPGQQFELVTERVDGRPLRVFAHQPRSLRVVVDELGAFGQADHIVHEDGTRWSFAETAQRVGRLARHLVELGVGPGDRVAIASRNWPDWPVAFWATVSIGAIAAPLNAWWVGDQLAAALADAEARVLVADTERLERLVGSGHRPVMPVLVAGPAEGSPLGRPLAEVCSSGSSQLPAVTIEPDDAATLFFTSGTTGGPKGVLGTHRNMLTNLMSVRWRLAVMAALDGVAPPQPSGQRALLLGVPLFHVTGAHSVMLPAAASGAKLVMMHRWDPVRAAELIEAEGVTAFTGVPTMGVELLAHPDNAERDLSSLTYLGAGGAPSPPELVRLVDRRLGVPAGNGYGMTETSALAVVNAGAGYLADPGSIGYPVPCNELEVTDPDGLELAPGQPGELWVRGPCVTKGYWRRPEASAETFVDGWVRTGDVALIEADGRVRIVDRLKDLIIRGGENVSTVEVEAALYEHPAVAEAAVVGLAHQRLGEEVAAVVVPRTGQRLTEDELRSHLAARLAAFMVPTRIWIRSEALPRNAAGKFVKVEIRNELTGEA